MSIELVEKEFLAFCASISLGELERNPEIEREIASIRRMIAQLKKPDPCSPKKPKA